MKGKVLAFLTAAALCSAASAQSKEFNEAQRAQALLQFEQLQTAVANKDIGAVSRFIEPEVYQLDHLAAGESGPEMCSAGEGSIVMEQKDIEACGDNVLRNLQSIRQITLSPDKRGFKTHKTEDKENGCVTTFSGSFSAKELGDYAPGMLVRIEVDALDSASDEQAEGCVGLTNHYFTLKNDRLMLTSSQSFP